MRLDESRRVEVRKRGLDGRVVSLHVAHVEDRAGAARGGQHALRLLGTARHRLLHEHVEATLERAFREVGVLRRGRRDRDEIAAFEKQVQRFEDGESEAAPSTLARSRIGVVSPDDLDSFDSTPGPSVMAPEVSETDHTDPDAAHRTMPLSELRTNSTNSCTSG